MYHGKLNVSTIFWTFQQLFSMSNNVIVVKANRKDLDEIYDLVNLAFKLEIGKSGIAYRKCDKYRLKDSARKHIDDMWVVKGNRKVILKYNTFCQEDTNF